jgi:hypothetical protein
MLPKETFPINNIVSNYIEIRMQELLALITVVSRFAVHLKMASF